MKRVYKRRQKSGLPLTMYAAAISTLLAAVMVTSPVQNVIAEEIGVGNDAASIRSLATDVDGVSGSPYTSDYLATDRQQSVDNSAFGFVTRALHDKVSLRSLYQSQHDRGFPSIDEVEQRIDKSESIVGRWKTSGAGINGVKISADMVGLGDFFVTINEDENGEKTADLTYSKGGAEPAEIHGLRLVEETDGDDTILKFDVKIPSSDTPSFSEGQKNLAKMAETFGLKDFGEVKVDEDGKLEISAEFELFDAVICLERQSEEV